MRLLLLLVFLAGTGAAGYYAYTVYGSTGVRVSFRTAKVERGELVTSVTATGTLEPEDLVDIGAQVVGRVKELGLDARGATDKRYEGKPVDYGARVEEGQVLAQIDDSVYRAQFNQAKAAQELSKANLLQLEAKLAQTDAEWTRAQKLRSLKLTSFSPTGSQSADGMQIKGISDADFVLAKANFEAAKANVEVGKATIAQNTATLQLADTNLGYTVIRSPVTGTIIDRRVNIGQTVVSSLNAPSLFLIAKDLRRMQVWASVNEADIGMLKVDMPVKFTVDAFPNDEFEGTVVQIRLNATMTQNVVTYTVVVANDNHDLKLLPYLTANVKFIVKQIPDVLLVPNGALRYKPRPDLIEPTPVPESLGQTAAASEPPAKRAADKGEGDKRERGTVWVQRGEFVAPIAVTIGETDGARTEVRSDELKEGTVVVLGEQQKAAVVEEVNNPFGPPKIPRSGPKPAAPK